MTDHFDKWINSMSDMEYEDMLDPDNINGFTNAQEEKALNIRTPPSKKELEDLELQQEFEELEELEEQEREERAKPEKPAKPERDVVFKEGITKIEQPIGEPITIRKIGERVTMVREPVVPRPTIEVPVVTPPKILPSRVIPPPRQALRSFTTAIKGAVRTGAQFIRRFFRI